VRVMVLCAIVCVCRGVVRWQEDSKQGGTLSSIIPSYSLGEWAFVSVLPILIPPLGIRDLALAQRHHGCVVLVCRQ